MKTSCITIKLTNIIDSYVSTSKQWGFMNPHLFFTVLLWLLCSKFHYLKKKKIAQITQSLTSHHPTPKKTQTKVESINRQIKTPWRSSEFYMLNLQHFEPFPTNYKTEIQDFLTEVLLLSSSSSNDRIIWKTTMQIDVIHL